MTNQRRPSAYAKAVAIGIFAVVLGTFLAFVGLTGIFAAINSGGPIVVLLAIIAFVVAVFALLARL